MTNALVIERSTGRPIEIAPSGQPLDPDEAMVWAFLAAHCRGRASAQTIPAIAGQVGIHKRAVHDILKRLLVHHGLPVVSVCRRDEGEEQPLGVYVGTTPSDLRAYLTQLRSRFRRMYPTYRAAKRLLTAFRGEQQALFDP
jgi:hypothetical protein